MPVTQPTSVLRPAQNAVCSVFLPGKAPGPPIGCGLHKPGPAKVTLTLGSGVWVLVMLPLLKSVTVSSNIPGPRLKASVAPSMSSTSLSTVVPRLNGLTLLSLGNGK